jgi:hypothetical protein
MTISDAFHRDCAQVPERACGPCRAEAARSKCQGETTDGYLRCVAMVWPRLQQAAGRQDRKRSGRSR